MITFVGEADFFSKNFWGMIERLPIYKKTYELTSTIYDAMAQFPKLHRYTLGEHILNKTYSLFKWIVKANKEKDEKRVEAIEEYLSDFEELRVFLRICEEKHILKINTLTNIFLLIDDIANQATGWKNYTIKEIEKKKCRGESI